MYLEIRKADEGALIFRPFRAFFISQTQRKQRNDAIKRGTKHRFDSIHFAFKQFGTNLNPSDFYNTQKMLKIMLFDYLIIHSLNLNPTF